METEFKPQPLFNRAAIKRHSLHCSQTLRAGKFKRVGQSFIAAVEASAEASIRRLAAPRDGVPAKFITGAAKKKLLEQFDWHVADIIASKVKAHPSLGSTLLD